MLAGCKPDSQRNVAEDSKVKTFEVQGILREVSPDHRMATIQHQKIPGYMPAMTMPFNVKVPQEFDGIEIGADITFKLVVHTNEHWIEDIRFLALRIENIPDNRFVPMPGMTSQTNTPAESPNATVKPYPLTTCIVSGEKIGEMGKPPVVIYKGQEMKFCCKDCVKDFNKDPDKWIKKLTEAEAKKQKETK